MERKNEKKNKIKKRLRRNEIGVLKKDFRVCVYLQ